MSAAGGLRVLHVLSKKGEKWQFVKITFYQINVLLLPVVFYLRL
jgi:hypothetical protein